MEDSGDDVCCVCLQDMRTPPDGDSPVDLMTLACCGHCAHVDCVQQWERSLLRRGRHETTCPLCRGVVPNTLDASERDRCLSTLSPARVLRLRLRLRVTPDEHTPVPVSLDHEVRDTPWPIRSWVHRGDDESWASRAPRPVVRRRSPLPLLWHGPGDEAAVRRRNAETPPTDDELSARTELVQFLHGVLDDASFPAVD